MRTHTQRPVGISERMGVEGDEAEVQGAINSMHFCY